ncbi:MAG: hypothetical protein JXB36_08175, partial [Gammaproteobacteria bacterium]|nr:hypothetical protein [Gammaproteobacteria bacterium]
MTGFWIGVAALCVVALAFLLWPLWRQRRSTGQWSWSALAAVALTVPVAVGLYLSVSTWQPEALERSSSRAALIAQAAEKLRQQPDDVEGWRLLGRSYVAIGEYGAAANAFAEAWRRTPVPDNDLKLSFAEAQVLADRMALDGPAGDLIEQVLAEEPSNPKALWYGSQRALGLGDARAARSRLTRLLELGPPEEIAQILRAQLTQLPQADEGSAASAGGEGAPAAEGPSITLRVRLAEELADRPIGSNA